MQQTLPVMVNCADSAPAPPQRYHALDGLRAFALILGIVFHSALSFVPGNFDWAVHERSTSLFLGYFVLLCHSFRLEIFFLMAGFFGRMVFHRRGFQAFAKDRVKRILIPFVIGWFFVAPLLTFVWILGDGVPPAQAATLSISDLIGRLTGARPGFLTRSHLWFLYYLMLLYAATLAMRAIFVRSFDQSGSARSWIDRKLSWVFRRRWAALVPALACSVFIWRMKEWGVDTPEKSLVPELPPLLLYAFIFCLGWMLNRQPDLLGVLTRRWPVHLGLGLLLSVVALVTIILAFEGRSDLKPVFVAVYSLMMWLMVFGVSGLFLRYLTKPSPAWRYLADSSYWLYITHLPLVTFLQVEFAGVRLPWAAKVLLINAVTFSVLLVLYRYLVRRTFIGATLNGKRLN